MIPKVIHYCWFGRSPLPEEAVRCIESWKKHLPEYGIKQWNEDNFDVNICDYTREAYASRMFAFVSDVARLYALYHEGGIYMDTDVEVLGSLDDFLHHVAFSGFEDDRHVSMGIIASEKGGRWVRDNLDYYRDRHFIGKDGSLDMTTNVSTVNDYMLSEGLKQNNEFQDFPGLITVYPSDFFYPKSHKDGKIFLTENTVTIHHFAGSWHTDEEKYINGIRQKLGGSVFAKEIAKLMGFMKFHGPVYTFKMIFRRLFGRNEKK